MHPVLARFLTADAAKETLRKEKAGEPLTPEEQHFVAAADANPKLPFKNPRHEDRCDGPPIKEEARTLWRATLERGLQLQLRQP